MDTLYRKIEEFFLLSAARNIARHPCQPFQIILYLSFSRINGMNLQSLHWYQLTKRWMPDRYHHKPELSGPMAISPPVLMIKTKTEDSKTPLILSRFL
jgi:hypothetical protein